VLEPTGSTVAVDARRALVTGRRIRLRYQGRADASPRDREIDPWALRVVASTWYLQGHDHGAGDLRTFRLDRVVDAEVTDIPVEVAPPDQLPAPRYQAGPDDVQVTLRVSRGGRWLADAVDHDAFAEQGDGVAELTFTTDAPRHVARLVLMAGGDAEVLAPTELVTTVADLATAAAAGYGVSAGPLQVD
jgi:proteasome accessory factor C